MYFRYLYDHFNWSNINVLVHDERENYTRFYVVLLIGLLLDVSVRVDCGVNKIMFLSIRIHIISTAFRTLGPSIKAGSAITLPETKEQSKQ